MSDLSIKKKNKNLMLLGKFFKPEYNFVFLGSYKVRYPTSHSALVDDDLFFPIVGNDFTRIEIFNFLCRSLLSYIVSYLYLKSLNKKKLKGVISYQFSNINRDKSLIVNDAYSLLVAMTQIASFMLSEKLPPGKISKSKNTANGFYQPDQTYVELKKVSVRLSRFEKGKGFRALPPDKKRIRVEKVLETISTPISEVLTKFVPDFRNEINNFLKYRGEETLKSKIENLDKIIKIIEMTNTRNRELEKKVMVAFQDHFALLLGKKKAFKLVRIMNIELQSMGFKIYRPYYYSVKNLIESHKNRFAYYKPKRDRDRVKSRFRKTKNIRRRYKMLG